jgi:hypothetical protein
MEPLCSDDEQGNPGHPRVTCPSVIVSSADPLSAALLLTPSVLGDMSAVRVDYGYSCSGRWLSL